MSQATSLEHQVTEIAMRATATACVGMHPSRVEAVAVPLAQALVDVVIGQEGIQNSDVKIFVETPNYIVFELWNRILDEVVKEIPAANQIEVAGICTRSSRLELMSDEWKKTIQKPMTPKKKI